MAITQALWLVIWCVTAIRVHFCADSSSSSILADVFLLFSLYWATEVFKHVLHCVTAGVIGPSLLRNSHILSVCLPFLNTSSSFDLNI